FCHYVLCEDLFGFSCDRQAHFFVRIEIEGLDAFGLVAVKQCRGSLLLSLHESVERLLRERHARNFRSIARLLKFLNGDRAVGRYVLTQPVPVIERLLVWNSDDAFRAVCLRISFWTKIINALLTTSEVCETHSFRQPTAEHDHDLVFHVHALISVYVLRPDDPAVTDIDERRARCPGDRLS